jgi:hypothetical protein
VLGYFWNKLQEVLGALLAPYWSRMSAWMKELSWQGRALLLVQYRRHGLHDWEAQMIQMKIRWGDLGAPAKPGTYPCGPHMVEITPGDIKLAKGNPDAVLIAIHPDFYPAETYLVTGLEFSHRVVGDSSDPPP